jgi:RHS repeat-associated protein
MRERPKFVGVMALLVLSSLMLAISGRRVYAQGATPERGFQPGGSYAVSDIETVSTTSGNMMLHFPVGKLPAGRGGLSAMFSLNYDSKLYDSHVHHEADPYATPIPSPVPEEGGQVHGSEVVVERNLLRQSDGGGWHYTYGYRMEIVNRDDQYDFGYQPQYPDWAAISRWKVRITFPDGSPHDFTLRGFNDEDRLHDGYSDVRPDGYRSWWAGGSCWPNSCVIVQDSPFHSGTLTYYSTDGTFARLDIQHDSDGVATNNPWTLYLSDGARVTNGGTRVYDRNNNYIDMGFTQLANGHYAEVLIDQLGRSVTLEYSAAPNEDDIRVKGVGGEEMVYRIKWKTIQVNKTYPTCTGGGGSTTGGGGCSNGLPEWIPNQRVVYEIDMPSQSGDLKYTFGYNAADYVPGSNTPSYGWGELSSITLPTGAQVSYQYANDNLSAPFDWQAVMQNTPTRKDLSYNREYDGASTPVTETWLYTLSPRIGLPSPFTSYITNPDGGTLVEWGDQNGHVYKSVQPDGTVVERLWRQNVPQGFLVPVGAGYSGVNWYVKTELTSVKDANGNLSKTAIKDYDHDKNGNVTQVKEYDWVTYAGVPRDQQGNPTGVPAGAPLKRVTQSAYLYPTPDASDSTTASANLYANAGSPNLRSLVSAGEVGNGSATLSRTEFTYDANGNLTQQKSWDSTKGGYSNPLSTSNSVAVSYGYDAYGNPTLSTDAKGHQTLTAYGPVGGAAGLYPTQVTSGYGSAVAQTTTAEYDFSTGLVTRATDPNGVASSTAYDVFGRPTLVRSAEGLAIEARTQIVYADSARRVVTRKDSGALGDGKLVSIVHYDQLGRVRLSRQLEDAATQSETDETQGVKVQARYAYSGANSYQLVSNPYRAGYCYQASSELTMGWTRSKSDSGGRVVEVQPFPGSGMPAPWGANTSSIGAVTTSYDAELTTVTDQAGKVRRSVMNAFGQLARVDEPDASGSLGAASSPAQPTSYSYDALGNLTRVVQGTQTRAFNYSSLARLTSATNPERGTVSYSYEDNGNLSAKTDARNVTITYAYDALNRNTTVDYSNTTVNPDVERHYDNPAAGSYGKGRFWYSYAGGNYSAGSEVEHAAVDSYDAMGRPLVQRQLFKTGGAWGATYQTSGVYNRAGFVTSQTYPSGHTVSYTPDAAGRLAAFTGNLGDGAQRAYSSNVSYDAASRLQQEQFGTQVPLYQKRHYNVRGQLYDVRLSTQSEQAAPWDWNRGALLDYYSQAELGAGTNEARSLSGTDNNGNLKRGSVYVPTDPNGAYNGATAGSYYTAQQSYSYDSLNRLTRVDESTGLTQGYTYDRFGNRQLDAAQTAAGLNSKQFTIDAATNRLTHAGMAYDAAGNLTQDTYSASAAQRAYDAENRMTMEQNSATTVFSRYAYDADGKRTRRDVGGSVTWQVYGFSGELLAEYAGGAAPASPQKEYGYRGGELLVTASAPATTTTGTSSRVNVAAAANGATSSASSYTPDNFYGAGTHTRPSDAIDGTRWLTDTTVGTGYWRAASVPQWLEVDFSGSKSISEIDVYTMRDNYADQSNPTASETFTTYGATSYNLQYFDGAAWQSVAGASVSGNNLVWRSFTFAPVTTTKIRLNVTAATDGVARIAEVEAWGTQAATPRVNVAASSNGATATAQNFTADGVYAGLHFQPSYANDGVRYIHPPDGDQYWRDEHGLASWVQVDFAGSKTIDEVDVYTLADYPAFLTQADPSPTQTFTQYGVTSFEVQYWTGSAWQAVQGGSVSGNNLVWKKLTFPAVTTTKIRVVVSAATDGVARIAEVEAYFGGGAQQVGSGEAEIEWLVSDRLGTPRMVVDQTGSLAGIKRHDYLPFGEEIGANVGGRTTGQGYSQPDATRQHFIGSERDDETGLDYMQARYYASMMGRFTSPDPLLNSGRPTNPASWNRYSYSLNNPLRFLDPSGLYEYDANATSKQKKRFEEQLNAANKNVNKIAKRYGANSDEYKDAKRALDAYGAPNKANGVIVAFGPNSSGGPGETSGGTSVGSNVLVTINIDSIKDNGDLAGVIGHEGSHAQDRADFRDAFSAALASDPNDANGSLTAVFNGPLNMTSNATETRAYGVSSVLAEFMLKNEVSPASGGGTFVMGNNQYVQQSVSLGGVNIWNPSWAAVDVKTVRQTRSSAIATGLKNDPYYSAKANKKFVE